MHAVQEDCEEPGRSRLCVADEHYVASLLSAHDMAESIDRLGRVTFTEWGAGGWHPATFYPGDAAEHIVQMRGSSDTAMCASRNRHVHAVHAGHDMRAGNAVRAGQAVLPL